MPQPTGQCRRFVWEEGGGTHTHTYTYTHLKLQFRYGRREKQAQYQQQQLDGTRKKQQQHPSHPSHLPCATACVRDIKVVNSRTR